MNENRKLANKNKNNNQPEYYIGLDCGSTSVGIVVVDKNNKIIKRRKKTLASVNLFAEAKSCKERREHRSSRRNNERKGGRIMVLRLLFADEIANDDAGFFIRLDESFLQQEDRSDNNKQKYGLFNDVGFTDYDYFRKYPTIFHLMKYLRETDEKPDVRLLYLAIANMLKHRGNFLNSLLSVNDDFTDLSAAYVHLLSVSDDYTTEYDFDFGLNREPDFDQMKHIYAEAKGKVTKKTQMKELLVKKGTDAGKCLVELFCGSSVNVAKIFLDLPDECRKDDKEKKKYQLDLSDSKADESLLKLSDLLDDDKMDVIYAAKQVYSTGVLADLLGGENYISDAKVASYEKHKKDLKMLKKVVKKYIPEKYDSLFRKVPEKEEVNYVAYVNSTNSNGEKCRRCRNNSKYDESKLFTKIQKLLEPLKNEDNSSAKEDPDVAYILEEIENKTFLPKQRTATNGVIPYQMYARELHIILQRASIHYPFLREIDDTGFTVSEKIEQLLSFRIPYFVGPLGIQHNGKEGYNVWAVRNPGYEKAKIVPWNFNTVINTKASMEEFIMRMVRKCTYLSDEKVLPKNSLLHESFQVLNELNNVTVNGTKLDVNMKQNIYNDLFCHKVSVSKKDLEEYLIDKGLLKPEEKGLAVAGISGSKFNNSLSSLKKMVSVFGEAALDTSNTELYEMMEQIIYYATLYGDEKKFLMEQIQTLFPDKLTEDQLKQISYMTFKDWGNLSKEFLLMHGTSKADDKSIIEAMWTSQDNLMQILDSKKHTYKKQLDKKTDVVAKELSEITYDDLSGTYMTAAAKRTTWIAIKMVREMIGIMGYPPKNIFIEMARGAGEKKESVSRKKQLTKLYEELLKSEESLTKELKSLYKSMGCTDKDAVKYAARDVASIKKLKEDLDTRTDNELKRNILYMYFLQLGRCIYTGKEADKNVPGNIYDREHIIPEWIGGESVISKNMALSEKRVNNEKSGTYPIASDIQKKMKYYWGFLKKHDFMTEEKYGRLMRTTPLSKDEMLGFAEHQLVDTRYSTKVLAHLLERSLPNRPNRPGGNTGVVKYVKAGWISKFRQEFDYDKVRCANDFHHVHDAYFAVVVGRTYDAKIRQYKNLYDKMKKENLSDMESYKRILKSSYNLSKVFNRDIKEFGVTVWEAPKYSEDHLNIVERCGTLNIIDKFYRSSMPITIVRTAYETSGEFYDATVYSKKEAEKSPGAWMPLKDCLDINKYGGYKKLKVAFYTLVSFKIAKFEGSKKNRHEVVSDTKYSIETWHTYKGNSHDVSIFAMTEHFKSIVEKREKGKVVDFKIVRKKILPDTIFKMDGVEYIFGGKSGTKILFSPNCQINYLQKTTAGSKPVEIQTRSNMPEDDFSKSTAILRYIGKIEKHHNLLANVKKEDRKYEEYICVGEDNKRVNLFTSNNNIAVFEYLQRKMKMSYFQKIVCGESVFGKIQQDKVFDKFKSLDMTTQCDVLYGIVNGLHDGNLAVNLSEIGGSKTTPRKSMVFNTNRSGVFKDANSFSLITQSVTGMFEYEDIIFQKDSIKKEVS